jgi:organic radical activating enzyme
MTNIPKTFCPAKWDEILVNLNANYVYSCCKSTPIKIINKEDISTALDSQKNSLLNGVQDSSCNYCWSVESQGNKSLRHEYLEKFDTESIEKYNSNQINPNLIEVNIGNECNFQCTYCNPKFSSQWETDVKKQSYKIYSDKHFYEEHDNNNSKATDLSIDWLSTQKNVNILKILGGEPLLNKNFFRIVDSIKSNELGFTTNLSCKKSTIDRVLALSNNYKTLRIAISLDSTNKIAEFTRYGMDFPQLIDNIDYLIANAPTNVKIKFVSLMTSITVRDFDNTVNLIDQYYQKDKKRIDWLINYTIDPKIFTFSTLDDKYKPNILETINAIKDRKYIQGLDTLEGAIKHSEFNKTLYGQMKHFLEEFSTRKNIGIPVII